VLPVLNLNDSSLNIVSAVVPHDPLSATIASSAHKKYVFGRRRKKREKIRRDPYVSFGDSACVIW
jgi:hypothetical protein